eukprot:SAG31_NODE_3212_length_4544_cov_1.849719_4_plen_52_part_00
MSDDEILNLCYRSHLVPVAGEVPPPRCGHAAASGQLGHEPTVVVFGGRQVT